jgi:hypothetical protein
MAKPKKQKTFRVWIEQVNQTYVDVKAGSKEEAHEKGYRKWRREEAHSYVGDVQEIDENGRIKY